MYSMELAFSPSQVISPPLYWTDFWGGYYVVCHSLTDNCLLPNLVMCKIDQVIYHPCGSPDTKRGILVYRTVPGGWHETICRHSKSLCYLLK